MPESKKRSTGETVLLVVIFVIVALIVLGPMFIWSSVWQINW